MARTRVTRRSLAASAFPPANDEEQEQDDEVEEEQQDEDMMQEQQQQQQSNNEHGEEEEEEEEDEMINSKNLNNLLATSTTKMEVELEISEITDDIELETTEIANSRSSSSSRRTRQSKMGNNNNSIVVHQNPTASTATTHNSSSSAALYSDETVKFARNALLEAVVVRSEKQQKDAMMHVDHDDGAVHSNTNYNDSEIDSIHHHVRANAKQKACAFFKLFKASSSTATATNTTAYSSETLLLHPGWKSPTEQRTILLHTMRSGFASTKQATRFFSGLNCLVDALLGKKQQNTTNGQLKTEEQELHGDDDGGDNDNDSDDRFWNNDPESIEFFALAAHLVLEYLEGKKEAAAEKASHHQQQQNRKKHIELEPPQIFMPEPACQTARSLHDILFALSQAASSNTDAAQPQQQHLWHDEDEEIGHGHIISAAAAAAASKAESAILRLCETWWLVNAVNKNLLVLQALPLLLQSVNLGLVDQQQQKVKATERKRVVHKHVMRLYQIRHAFEVIDFNDDDSQALRQLLLRVASSPLCLKLPEGQRFLAFLFHIDDGSLIQETHQAIRAQLSPQTSRTILQAYSNIYFKAWKEAPVKNHDENKNEYYNDDDEDGDSGPLGVRERIESIALNDLCYSVLHVAKKEMAQTLRMVLKPFHEARNNSDVQSLLFRLYGPILWRAVTAANALVRVHAVHILAQVFPLTDPSLATTKESLEKGCKCLETLLEDRDYRVRVATSQAVLQVLFDYWDVIDSSNLRTLLNILVTKHLSDISSWQVRVQVVQTMTQLLKVPQTHAVLRALLPKVGNLIHDKVEKVRLAVVNLLHQVKATEGFKYFHIVPVDHLNARLADELRQQNSSDPGTVLSTGPVARSLAALLANSYFPLNADGITQHKRCLQFLQKDPKAATAFYANLALNVPPKAVVKLTGLLFRGLYTAVVESNERETSQQQGSTTTGKRKAANNTKQLRRQSRGRPKKGSTNESSKDGGDDSILTGSESNATQELSFVSASNTSLMANVAEIISILWQSVEEKLAKPIHKDLNTFIQQVFSGSALTQVLEHYETKRQRAVTDESFISESSDNSQLQEDCYRICASMVQCAGRLSPDLTAGLLSHASNVLDKITVEQPCSHAVSYITLLCRWGMTEDAASLLATSIDILFVERENELQNFASPEENTRKRRRGRKSKLPGAHLNVDELPPQVALDILLHILQGCDANSELARDYLFSSSLATSTIFKVLERGLQCAEHLLVSPDPSFHSPSLESEMESIIIVCELYGRFAFHRQAFHDANLDLSEESRHFLEWITSKVLPIISRPAAPFASLQQPAQQQPRSPFSVPDMSQISVQCSFATGTTLSLPLSPAAPAGPARRRPNCNGTPNRMDEDKDPSFERSLAEDESSFLISRAVAISLLLSSVVIYSEWLAVGGSGAHEISLAAIQWIGATFGVQTNNNNENNNSAATESKQALLEVFSRMAILLCKTQDDFSILRALLCACNGSWMEGTETTLHALADLMGGPKRSSASQVAKTISVILESAHEVLQKSDGKDGDGDISLPLEASFALSLSLNDELLPTGMECISQAVDAIVQHKQASLETATQLVKHLENLWSSDETTYAAATNSRQKLQCAAFDVKFLLLLHEVNGENKDIVKVVRGLRKLSWQDQEELQAMVNDLLTKVDGQQEVMN